MGIYGGQMGDLATCEEQTDYATLIQACVWLDVREWRKGKRGGSSATEGDEPRLCCLLYRRCSLQPTPSPLAIGLAENGTDGLFSYARLSLFSTGNGRLR